MSYGNNNGNNNNILGDFLNLWGIMLGYENLMENRQQSADNNVAKHNQEQAEFLLNDLHAQFDKQNEMLAYQNTLLEEILNILRK
ncbi:MAG: hypothetical protein ACI4PF_02335 [Christensenellales bacterium]